MINAVQVVRDAFSALDMQVEIVDDIPGAEPYVYLMVTMDGHDILQLSVEDMRDGSEPEPTYERKPFQTLTQAVEETAAIPHVKAAIEFMESHPPGADSPGYLEP
jgi:hypothetical protein